jgi:hypothetical protein
MPRKQPVWFILIIQIAPGVILALIWIIPKPRQSIGGALKFSGSFFAMMPGVGA